MYTFVSVEGLEVEFWNLQTDELELVKSADSLDFLLQAKASFAWIFIGRLLRRGPDAETLADPGHFTTAIDRVFANIRSIWRVTNQRGYATAV